MAKQEGYNKKLGAYGESLAANFLIKRGYKIIAKNFRSIDGEIDLVAKNNQQELLFIEVKTRTADIFGYPEHAVNQMKIKKIIKTAEYFLAINHLETIWEIAIISVEINIKKSIAKIKKFKLEL